MREEVGVIQIKIKDEKLARVLTDARRGRRRYGDVWPPLQRRLALLDAAPTLATLINAPGRCHELTGNRRGQLALHVTANVRVVFSPDHDPSPTTAQGVLVWADVTAILIEEVVDYHGE